MTTTSVLGDARLGLRLLWRNPGLPAILLTSYLPVPSARLPQPEQMHPWARAIAWSWACLELGNGIGHSLLALARGSYFPGVATAPLLLGLSIALMRRLGATSGRASGLGIQWFGATGELERSAFPVPLILPGPITSR